MPQLSAIFDAQALIRLRKLEQEDEALKSHLYGGGRTMHIETPQEKAQYARERALKQQYREIFYTQFQTASDLDQALASPRYGPAIPHLRSEILEEASALQRQILPVAPPRPDGPFSGGNEKMTTGYRDFDSIPTLGMSSRGPKGPDAYVTVERGNKEANVCLSHVPGSIGGTPTNFIEKMADVMRKELEAEGYKGKNINFYIHVPKECAITREVLAKVEFEHSFLGGWKLKPGQPDFSQAACLDHMPHGLAHSLKDSMNASPAALNRDSDAVKANAYRNFTTGLR